MLSLGLILRTPLGGAKYDAPAEKGTGNPELLATQAYLEGGVNCGGPHVSGWMSFFFSFKCLDWVGWDILI